MSAIAVAFCSDEFGFHVDGRPASTNDLWRHNNKRTYKTSRAAVYHEKMRVGAFMARPVHWDTHGKYDVSLAVTGSRMDIDAPIKTILDALNGVVWVDDKQVHHLDVTIVRSGPPGVSVKVRRI